MFVKFPSPFSCFLPASLSSQSDSRSPLLNESQPYNHLTSWLGTLHIQLLIQLTNLFDSRFWTFSSSLRWPNVVSLFFSIHSPFHTEGVSVCHCHQWVNPTCPTLTVFAPSEPAINTSPFQITTRAPIRPLASVIPTTFRVWFSDLINQSLVLTVTPCLSVSLVYRWYLPEGN